MKLTVPSKFTVAMAAPGPAGGTVIATLAGARLRLASLSLAATFMLVAIPTNALAASSSATGATFEIAFCRTVTLAVPDPPADETTVTVAGGMILLGNATGGKV